MVMVSFVVTVRIRVMDDVMVMFRVSKLLWSD